MNVKKSAIKIVAGGVLMGLLTGCGYQYNNDDAVAELYSTLSVEEQQEIRGGLLKVQEERVNQLMDEVFED